MELKMPDVNTDRKTEYVIMAVSTDKAYGLYSLQ